jgi:hypothetical protein
LTAVREAGTRLPEFHSWNDSQFRFLNFKVSVGNTMVLKNSLIVFVLIVLSGFFDSWGFVYAAKIWQKDALSWLNLGKSTLGWGIGITLYIISLRFMARLGVTSAEIQTVIWFAMTIIGVVIFSGKFFEWPRTEQIVAVLVLAGLGWLLYRTGG